jgi:hypothetical protein
MKVLVTNSTHFIGPTQLLYIHEFVLVRSAAACSFLYHRRNEDILEELNVYPVENKLAQCKKKCLKSSHLAGRYKIPRTNLLTVDMSEVEHLDDHLRDR